MSIATVIVIVSLALVATALIGLALVLMDRQARCNKAKYMQMMLAARVDGAQLSRMLAEHAEHQARSSLAQPSPERSKS